MSRSEAKALQTTRPFHELLRAERAHLKLSVRTCAERARVSEREYRGWEDGEGLPTSFEVRRIYGQEGRLHHYLPGGTLAAPVAETTPQSARAAKLQQCKVCFRPIGATSVEGPLGRMHVECARSLAESERSGGYAVIPKLGRGTSMFPYVAAAAGLTEVAETPAPPESMEVEVAAPVEVVESTDEPEPEGPLEPPAPPPPDVTEARPLSFAAALRQARLKEGIDQGVLADLVGVSSGTISAWERGEAVPVRVHYEKLRDLLPGLREGHVPPSRDIAPPVGPKGKKLPPAPPRGPNKAPPSPIPDPEVAAPAPPAAEEPPRAIDGLDLLVAAVALADQLYGGRHHPRLVPVSGVWACDILSTTEDLTAVAQGEGTLREAVEGCVRVLSSEVERRRRALDDLAGIIRSRTTGQSSNRPGGPSPPYMRRTSLASTKRDAAAFSRSSHQSRHHCSRARSMSTVISSTRSTFNGTPRAGSAQARARRCST